jgi:general secretion pathway protein D
VKNAAALCLLALTAITAAAIADAQSSEAAVSTPASSTASQGGVPIEQLVAVIAKKTGKRFVLDPRVHASIVLVGTTPADLGYPEFLTVLEVYGFAAVENGRLVRVVPDANLRQYATPVIGPRDSYPGSEYVTEILATKNVSAAQLIPILRPMVSQYGHLAAYPGTNMLILSDHFDNVRRLEGMIRTLDSQKPQATDSTVPAPAATQH